jgi:hypothetical protein
MMLYVVIDIEIDLFAAAIAHDERRRKVQSSLGASAS